MSDIDEIMEMLDGNRSPKIQEKGRALAKEIKCINVFLQPNNVGYSKNVWDNCAIILSERTDEELKRYLYELFKWLVDMNWPGADCIFQRLIEYKDKEWFNVIFNICIKEAKLLHEFIWLETLVELGKFHGIQNVITDSDIDYIMYLMNAESDEDEQIKGIELAKNIKDLSILFNPIKSKSLCENCAKVIISKSDKELKPYLMIMFDWIKDLNWPGAYLIYERLKTMPEQFTEDAYSICLSTAEQTDDYTWKQVLEDLKSCN